MTLKRAERADRSDEFAWQKMKNLYLYRSIVARTSRMCSVKTLLLSSQHKLVA